MIVCPTPPWWGGRRRRRWGWTRNSRGGISVSVQWGGGGWRRGAGWLELCGTGLSLSLTVAVFPTVSRHPCYGRLPSKQDTWGANIKSNSALNSMLSWHHFLKDHASVFMCFSLCTTNDITFSYLLGSHWFRFILISYENLLMNRFEFDCCQTMSAARFSKIFVIKGQLNTDLFWTYHTWCVRLRFNQYICRHRQLAFHLFVIDSPQSL